MKKVMIGIVFDFDGPIFNGREVAENALNKSLKTLNLDVKFSDLRGKPLYYPELLIDVILGKTTIDCIDDLKQKYRCTLKEMEKETSIDKNIISSLRKIHESYNIKLGLITNRKRGNVDVLLKYYDLEKYFDFIAGSDSFSMKPSSEALIEFMKQFNLESKDVVFIGDSDSDYLCANNVNIKYYHAAYSQEPSSISIYHADYLLKSTSEIFNIVSNFNNDSLQSYDSIPNSIERALRQNKISYYVGAGVSIPSGLGNWVNAYLKIFKNLGLEHYFDEGDLLESIQLISSDDSHSNQLYNEFREYFKTKPDVNPNQFHYAIVKGTAGSIWTSNYDNLFETAINNCSLDIPMVYDDESLMMNLDKDKLLIKMNGDFEHLKTNNKGIVFTQEQFDLFEVERKEIWRSFEEDFRKRCILFIGVSINDPALKRMLSVSKRKIQKSNHPHFILTKRSEDLRIRSLEKAIIKKYESYGIQTILFDSYESILRFVQKVAIFNQKPIIGISGVVPPEIDGEKKYNNSLYTVNETSRFCKKLGCELSGLNYRITSGCAPNVGIPFVEGAYKVSPSNSRFYIRRGGGRKYQGKAMAIAVDGDDYQTMREVFIGELNLLIAVAGEYESSYEKCGTVDEILRAMKIGIPVILFPQFGGAINKYYEALFEQIKISYSSKLRDELIKIHEVISPMNKDDFSNYLKHNLSKDIEQLLMIQCSTSWTRPKCSSYCFWS